MNIDRQIRQWAQMILNESCENDKTNIMETFVASRHGYNEKVIRDDSTSEIIARDASRLMVQAQFWEKIAKNHGGGNYQVNFDSGSYNISFDGGLDPVQVYSGSFSVESDGYWTYDSDDIREVAEQLEKVLQKKMHLGVNKATVPTGVYNVDATLYGSKKVRVVFKVDKPIVIGVPQLDMPYSRGKLHKPNLPKESIDDQANLNEAEESPITMLFRTRPNVDDKAGKITFTSINEMKNFIESVGGEYSEQIADGFTQGKLMSIDLSQAIRQLAIQQQKKS